MVDFVEEGAGEELIGFNSDRGAILELGGNFRFFGAGDESVNIGNGKAAFVIFHGFTRGLEDFRV